METIASTSKTDKLKMRVIIAKANINNNVKRRYSGEITKAHPHYKTAKGVALIQNVWNLRQADERLTEIIESLVTHDG